MTSRAHSNGCYTGDLWLGRLVAFHELLPLCCVHQLPGSQKSLHSSRNGSSRLLYAQWMMYLDRFSVIIFAYFLFFFSCKTTTYELGFGDLVLFPKSTIQRICVSSGCTFQIFRGKFYDCWSEFRDICLIAFFFRSLFSPKLQVFLRPIGARSTDRLLWTLKRSRDNPSPSFFSLHMNFSTSSFYSVVFVVAFVFFRLFGLQSSAVYSEACEMQNLLQTGLSSSMPSLLDTWLVFNCCFWCEFL